MLDGNLKLNGKFKFDVYDNNGSLNYSIEKGNFITPTGLSYINDIAIADCFRYISIGTGSGQNTITGIGTTGLQYPLTGSGYYYIGGSQSTFCSNTRGNQYFSLYCGTTYETSGLKLSRGWRIPSTGYFDNDYNLSEFMVTPGPPRMNGFLNGPTGICHCNQQAYLSSLEEGPVVKGIESIDFYTAYPHICDANKAFSRIIQSLPVKTNQYILAQYSLLVSLDTGIKVFSFPSHRDNTFDGVSGEGEENWNGSSGRYSLIQYGLKKIASSSSTVSTRTQINQYYQFRAGESYIPNGGQGLEPSCPIYLRTGYLSSDNIQCFSHPIGLSDYGLTQNVRVAELPSGVAYFNTTYGDTLDSRYTILRKMGGYFPSQDNYNFGAGYPLSEGITTLTINESGISHKYYSGPISGRRRSKILSYQFSDAALQNRFPVRSFVMGYQDYASFPVLDLIFYPRSGNQFIQNPSPQGYKASTGNYGTGLFFPTGYASRYTPFVTETLETVSGTETITSTGYFLWYVNRSSGYNLHYPAPPGNHDYIHVERDTIDSRFHTGVLLTGYAVPESIAQTGHFSGLYWTGGFIPPEAVQFSVGLSIRNLQHPSYDGAVSPYVTIGCYAIDSFSGIPTGANYRIFFSGKNPKYSGDPIYIGRNLFVPPSGLEVSMDLTGYIGTYTYFEEYNGYNLPYGMATKFNNIFTGGYSYFDENNMLLMQFKLDWSAPCPSGVEGC